MLALALVALTYGANAQRPAKDAVPGYPNRPIRILVPYTPGGTADILARVIGQKLSDSWGQQVVVDNRAGSGGIIGTEIAATAPRDGYTLMLGNTPNIAINPALYKKLAFDTQRDFAPITHPARECGSQTHTGPA